MKKLQSKLIETFAANLRKLRETKGYSQEELASRAGLDRTYVSGCERGIRNPSLASVEKLANALNIPAKEFLNE